MQTFEVVSAALEDITGIMGSCRVYEKIHWAGEYQSAKAVIQHLPELYAQCLRFMAKAIEYFSKDTFSESCMFHSIP